MTRATPSNCKTIDYCSNCGKLIVSTGMYPRSTDWVHVTHNHGGVSDCFRKDVDYQ